MSAIWCLPDGLLVGRQRADERGQRLAIVADVPLGGLAVVDEKRDLHRLGRRRDAQHLARDVVFADDDVGRPEARRPDAPLLSSALT